MVTVSPAVTAGFSFLTVGSARSGGVAAATVGAFAGAACAPTAFGGACFIATCGFDGAALGTPATKVAGRCRRAVCLFQGVEQLSLRNEKSKSPQRDCA